MSHTSMHRLSDATAGAASTSAFAFIQSLARELNAGTVQLPGYPAVVSRIAQMLNDPNVDMTRVVQAIGSEPTIAGQIMRLANSAALNPQGVAIPDLRTAIKRIGLHAVRTATTSFAMRQLRSAPELRGLEQRIETLWHRSVHIASLAQGIARRYTQLNSDAAMLAGLLEGSGRLYILARARTHSELLSDPEAYRVIEEAWHISIAVALLESWGMASEIIDAIRECKDLQRDARGAASLTDVLMAAALLVDCDRNPARLQAQIEVTNAFQRLKLDSRMCEQFIEASVAEVSSLRAALSG